MSNPELKVANEELTRCSYIVPRKKRNCRMLVKPGKKFCGEHDVVKSINELNTNSHRITSNRIVCPNDSKHTCNANKLEKHLLVCPSRPKPTPKYSLKGANTSLEEYKNIENHLTLNSISDDHLMNVIEKIENLYKTECFEDNISKSILSHKEVEAYVSQNPAFGPAALKHLKQNSSLLANLEKDIRYEVNYHFE